MMSMITGYWVSQCIGAIARLGIADHLAGGPRSAAELARHTKVNPDALHRVMRCCASRGIFVMGSDGRFDLTPLGETLRSGVPGSLRDFANAETAPGHWLPWGKLDAALQSGAPSAVQALGDGLFEYYSKQPDEAAAFSRAMGNLSALVASEIMRLTDFSASELIVDVGGATGVLIAAVLDANPNARGVLFDMPHVVADAKAHMVKRGLAERVDVVAGDFFADVPAGDTYILKHILHDWDDAKAVMILRRCKASMRKGGRVVVIEMVLPDDNVPSMAQLMDINMLVLLSGRERTRQEFAKLFSEAGLKLQRVTATHSPFFIIEAVPEE
jgi:hypothetical protein